MKGGKEEWKKKSRVEGQEKLQNRSTYLAQEKAGKKKKKRLGMTKGERGKRPTRDELSTQESLKV